MPVAVAGASKILIVDDEADIRRMLGLRLQHHGFVTAEAHDGEAALSQCSSDTSIDLVLLDLMMPGLDGYTVLQRLRERYGIGELPIIILSAKDQGKDVIEALRLGANDYIAKPFDFKLLYRRIERHLALSQSSSTILGNYKLEDQIGEGGMGVVYRAKQMDTNQTVAVKVLPRSLTVNPTFVKRFEQEAQLASRVTHPNIVQMYNSGCDGETHFIAMEYIDGIDLADLRESRTIGYAEALRMVRDIASGLGALAKAGIIHRDIKPENIIITRDGTAQLTDFGIARDIHAVSRVTDIGVGIGSLIYASPEQLEGKGDAQADIYSLGCTLFFAITGHDPFPDDMSLDQLYRAKNRRPPKIDRWDPNAPEYLVALARRMMDPNPLRRSKNHQAILAQIEGYLSGATSHLPWQGTVFRFGTMTAATLLALFLLWKIFSYG